jgi:hypothetical protein
MPLVSFTISHESSSVIDYMKELQNLLKYF